MLPKIQHPVFEETVPSTKEKIKFRPFLVREEKILLTAKESGEQADIINAIIHVINNCVITEDFDIADMPLFDLEYLFIKFRSKSISNIVKIEVEDIEDLGKQIIAVDLEDLEVIYDDKHVSVIIISPDIGLKMKYPTPALAEKIRGIDDATELTHAMISECIDCVYDGDDVYPWKEAAENEREEFLENIPIDAYNKIKNFFETSPKIVLTVDYKNKSGKERQLRLDTLNDFFI